VISVVLHKQNLSRYGVLHKTLSNQNIVINDASLAEANSTTFLAGIRVRNWLGGLILRICVISYGGLINGFWIYWHKACFVKGSFDFADTP